MKALVVCIGAITLDLIASIDRTLADDERVVAGDAVLSSGGPAATAAVALARLCIPVAFVGAVGDDAAGELVRAALEQEGVDASGLHTVGGRTAMSPVLVNLATGHRSIAAFYGTLSRPVVSSGVIDMCRHAEWVHVDHVGFATVSTLRAGRVTTPISVDGGNPIDDLSLRHVDLYAPTEPRLLQRYPGRTVGSAIREALAEGPRMVAVTRGSSGSVAASRQAYDASEPPQVVSVEAFSVPVVSTLGAGDVFHGGLLAGLVRGLEIRSALIVANAAAALSCRALDGRSAIPTWDELLAFVADHGFNLDDVGRN